MPIRAGANLSAGDVKVNNFIKYTALCKFVSVLFVVVFKQYFVILLAENDDVFPRSFLKSLKK